MDSFSGVYREKILILCRAFSIEFCLRRRNVSLCYGARSLGACNMIHCYRTLERKIFHYENKKEKQSNENSESFKIGLVPSTFLKDVFTHLSEKLIWVTKLMKLIFLISNVLKLPLNVNLRDFVYVWNRAWWKQKCCMLSISEKYLGELKKRIKIIALMPLCGWRKASLHSRFLRYKVNWWRCFPVDENSVKLKEMWKTHAFVFNSLINIEKLLQLVNLTIHA